MDILPLCQKVRYKPETVADGQVCFNRMPITVGYTACKGNDTLNLGRYIADMWKCFHNLECRWSTAYSINL